jgi:hypothetical protein
VNETITLDCDTCVGQHSALCDDCVVTFLVGRDPGDAVVIDAATERALRVLGEGGLVPKLQHRRRAMEA